MGKAKQRRNRLFRLFAFILTILLSLTFFSIALAAPPPNWDGSGATYTDCSGISEQAGTSLLAPAGAALPKCQVYDYYDSDNWNLFETLYYDGDANYSNARTADIQEATVFTEQDSQTDIWWLFLEWDHVDPWTEPSDANAHYHYVEIDVDGDEQGDYYVGWQAKDGILDAVPTTQWRDANVNSLLDAEFRDNTGPSAFPGNGDIGGSTPQGSNNSSGTKGDGYETDHAAGNDKIYARQIGGDLQLAIDWSYLGGPPPASYCVRFWTGQSSTLEKDKQLWHDQHPSSDLGDTFDNTAFVCGTPTAVDLVGIAGTGGQLPPSGLAAGLMLLAFLGFGAVALKLR